MKVATIFTITFQIGSLLLLFETGKCQTKPSTWEELNNFLGKEIKIPVKEEKDSILNSLEEKYESGPDNITKTTANWQITKQIQDVVAFDPNVASLYPGALVQGQSLPNGVLDPVTTIRTPLTITVTGLATSGQSSIAKLVKNPSLATVTNAIASIVRHGENTPQSVAVGFSKQIVHSMEESFLKVGANFSWATGSVKAGFNSTTQEGYSKLLVRLTERYYTASCPAPSSPAGFISKSANIKSLSRYISNDTTKGKGTNPLCYVSSITYGRELWLLIESKKSSTEVQAALEVSLNTLATNAHFEIDASSRKILSESNIQSMILGGGHKAAVDFLEGPEKISALSNFIKAGGDDLRKNPPQPISYEVSYLSDNTIARLSPTTNYKVITEIASHRPIPLVSARVTFKQGTDGKDRSTGLRVFIFDSRNLSPPSGKNWADVIIQWQALHVESTYAELYNNTDQGMTFEDNNNEKEPPVTLPMAMETPTNDIYLKNCVLIVQMFITGNDTWRFTPTVHFLFADGSTMTATTGDEQTLSENHPMDAYMLTPHL